MLIGGALAEMSQGISLALSSTLKCFRARKLLDTATNTTESENAAHSLRFAASGEFEPGQGCAADVASAARLTL